MRILYVDDERSLARFRLFAAEAIPAPHTYALVADPGEALRYAQTHAVALTFLDVELGGEAGLQLLERLRAEQPLMYFAFVVAHSGHALRAFEAGALGYLLKPPPPAQFRRVVEKAERLSELRRLSLSPRGRGVPSK